MIPEKIPADEKLPVGSHSYKLQTSLLYWRSRVRDLGDEHVEYKQWIGGERTLRIQERVCFEVSKRVSINYEVRDRTFFVSGSRP